MNVLVVDDHATNRKLLRVTLEAEGFDISEAADGQEAIELLNREPADVIISDILMPRMDGYRLCSELRHTKRFRDVPIIIYSSTYTSPADEKLALQVGADRYVKKPAPSQVLIGAIRETCGEAANGKHHADPLPEELTMLREYSATLVRKLEERNTELEEAQKVLASHNERLEGKVKERTAELEAANVELQAFNYSVAHDLRSPLTAVCGIVDYLKSKYGPGLDEQASQCLQDVADTGKRMADTLSDLLRLSVASHRELRRGACDLSGLAHGIAARLQKSAPTRKVDFLIEPGARVEADEALLLIALENLMGNAWKYTGNVAQPRIEFGRAQAAGKMAYFVRDNGAGFDMAKAKALFQPFQRMHTKDEFPGTGLGLTIAQRIIQRHGGQLRAEAERGKGATFYFTLSR